MRRMRYGLTPVKLWIPETVLAEMVVEAQRCFPKETGGVWMGYRGTGAEDLVITHMIGPGPGAMHRTDAFQPDATYQHAEIERHYHASGRLDTFLGDWHTHPRSTAYLSRKDRKALREVAESASSAQSRPIMGILAGGKPWKLGAWRFRPTWYGSTEDPLKLCFF